MQGVYSIAEVIDDSNKHPEKTVFAFIDEPDMKFSVGQSKSLDRVGLMVQRNGGKYFRSLSEISDFLNS
jgi:hypothetical protein